MQLLPVAMSVHKRKYIDEDDNESDLDRSHPQLLSSWDLHMGTKRKG